MHLWAGCSAFTNLTTVNQGPFYTLDISTPLRSLTQQCCDCACKCVLTCREPDVPAWAPLLYQLQLLDIREKPDPLTLPVADRIRVGNQKRERGNFHFQREEFCLAARAYRIALDVLSARSPATPGAASVSAGGPSRTAIDSALTALPHPSRPTMT